MDELQNIIITVLGKKGSGKSYLTQHYLIPLSTRPVFIYDKLNDYQCGLIFTDIEELIDHFVFEKNKSGVYIFRPFSDEQSDYFLTFVRKFGRPCTIVFEEIDLICTPTQIHDDLSYLLKYGRHFGVNLICISRRPAEINRLVTSQSDFLISFKQTENRDLAYLKQLSDKAEHARDLSKDEHNYLIIGDVPEIYKELQTNSHCVVFD